MVENTTPEKDTTPTVTFSKEEQELHRVVKSAIDYTIAHYYPSRFEVIKAKYQVNVDQEKQVDAQFPEWTNLSCPRHNIIDMSHDTFKNDLISQNFTPKTLALHPCNRKYSSDAQDTYDRHYHRSWYEGEVADRIYSEATLIWDSYAYFWYKTHDDCMVPIAEHISFFEMFLEPMATSFDESRYKIVRKIMDKVDVIQKYERLTDWDKKTFWTGKSNKESLNDTSWDAIMKADLSKIWDIDSWSKQYRKYCDTICEEHWWDSASVYSVLQGSFDTWAAYESIFGYDEENPLCEVIEVWRKTLEWYKVDVLVNWHALPLNEYTPLQHPMFGNVYFEESIGSPYHRWIWQKLIQTQRKADMLTFVIDNAFKMHAFPDYLAHTWLKYAGVDVVELWWSGISKVYTPSNKNMNNGQPFKAIEYIGKDIIQLARQRLQDVVQEGFAQIGINAYALWADGRVERLSAWIRLKQEQHRSRSNTMRKSIAQALNKSYYVWISNMTAKDSKQLLERIDDDGELTLQDLDVKTIEQWFEILISSEWFREETIAQAWQNILNTMNVAWEFLRDEFGDKADMSKLFCYVADAYGLDKIELYTNEERLAKKKQELEFQLDWEECQRDILEERQQKLQEEQEKEARKEQRRLEREAARQQVWQDFSDPALQQAANRASQISQQELVQQQLQQQLPQATPNWLQWINSATDDQIVQTNWQWLVIPQVQ